MNKPHVGLLLGGLSGEREVSLTSGNAVLEVLEKLEYPVTKIDFGHDICSKLQDSNIDLIFNSLHGTYGEDGCIQGVLELLKIPYTHSGVMASAIAMNKQKTIEIMLSAGIECIPGGIYSSEEVLAGDVLPRPYVIKPVAEGSSLDLYMINEGDDLPENRIKLRKEWLVEKYIPGKELTAAFIGDKPYGVMEIRPKNIFYDYESKYTSGTEYLIPADISESVYDLVLYVTNKAHKILGCNTISRSDFRYDVNGDGKVYFMEINTHPGLTPLSLVPQIARHYGISFEDIVELLIKEASCEKG